MKTLDLFCALSLFALGIAVTGCSSGTSCHTVSGALTSTIVAPPTCTGASGLCTHGMLTGDITATYDFTGDTQMMDTNPAHPNRTLYTGKSVITPSSNDGIITSNDTGYLDSQSMTAATFQTTVNMMGGTQHWTAASGTLIAPGMADFATGMLTGTYSGMLCD